MNRHPEETIAAVSTPPGEGGIGVVRLSGPRSLEVARRVFRSSGASLEAPEPRRMYYGRITRPEGGEGEAEGRVIDDGFLIYMTPRRSFTGEESVELQCHGGSLVVRRVLEACLEAGARAAGPGEFTRRAFMNGRMDLARAEAVIDVIRAETDSALDSARARLDGVFSREVDSIKDPLVGLLTRVEAGLDFPEEEDVESTGGYDLPGALAEAAEKLERLLAGFEEGRALREGVRTVILGRPNVGKSSLLNVLLREDRAIVTKVPGTTRDIIEEVVNIRGLPVVLADTAGLRSTSDHVESIGVERAREKARSSALAVFVVDASAEDFSEDVALLEAASPSRTVVVANKADLAPSDDGETLEGVRRAFPSHAVCLVSSTTTAGIDGLRDAVYEAATSHEVSARAQAPLVASARHREALRGALEAVGRAREADHAGAPDELMAAEIRRAVDRLGEITGETTTEDILERIFSDFCIGK